MRSLLICLLIGLSFLSLGLYINSLDLKDKLLELNKLKTNPQIETLSGELAECKIHRHEFLKDTENLNAKLIACESKQIETCNPIVNHINKQGSCGIANLDGDMQKIVSVVVSKNDYDNRYHTSYILENDDYSRTECRQGDFIFSQ